MERTRPINWVAQALLVWTVVLSGFATALPSDLASRVDETPSEKNDTIPSLLARENEKFLLRVLPLGASITEGYTSEDGNGYRGWIRQQLRYSGWEVNMIGSQKNGTMSNNENEGYVGYRVDQTAEAVDQVIPQQPNLILINAGTDDALQKHKLSTVGVRMNELLTKLYNEIPGTTIILSTLLPNTAEPKLVKEISSQYRKLAAIRRQKKDRLVLADMSNAIKVDELEDATHPTSFGYKKMASVWWAAIQEAEKENMLQKAKFTGESGTIKESLEQKLDGHDSTGDPHLPAYTAPAQPSCTVPGHTSSSAPARSSSSASPWPSPSTSPRSSSSPRPSSSVSAQPSPSAHVPSCHALRVALHLISE